MEQIRFQIFVSPSYPLFKRWILEFIRPHPISIFNVPYSLGLTYLNRSIVGLRHLRDYKFWHNFRDSLSPICLWNQKALSSPLLKLQAQKANIEKVMQNIEKVSPNFLPLNESNLTQRQISKNLMQNIEKVTPNFLPLNESNLTQLLLY